MSSVIDNIPSRGEGTRRSHLGIFGAHPPWLHSPMAFERWTRSRSLCNSMAVIKDAFTVHSILHKVITLTHRSPCAVGQIAKLVAASAAPFSGAQLSQLWAFGSHYYSA